MMCKQCEKLKRVLVWDARCAPCFAPQDPNEPQLSEEEWTVKVVRTLFEDPVSEGERRGVHAEQGGAAKRERDGVETVKSEALV